MFYSQFILAKKGPLGTIWIAAHLERKLRKNQVTETNISVSVDSILFPEVPIALRLSGHLLLGVVRIYSRKVNYLFHDCSEALVKIKQAFHAGAVDLPPEAATAPFHSITLPETFDLDEFEPLLDRELNLLHSNGGIDHHVSSREQITLQDPLEDSSYLGSQFELDERFPEADAPRLGLDFDEDLLDKPLREASPAATTLEEDEEMALEEDVIPTSTMDATLDYGQMDRMDALDDIDDHQEPETPGLNIDNMDLDYEQEIDGLEFDQPHRSPHELKQLEPDFQLETDEHDNEQGEVAHQEPVTPGSPVPESEVVRDEYSEPHDEQLEGEKLEELEEEDKVEKQDLESEVLKQVEEEILERELQEETLKRDVEEQIFGKEVQEETFDHQMEEERLDGDAEEEIVTRGVEHGTFELHVDEGEGVTEKGVEEEQIVGEGFEGDSAWQEKEVEQREVPEYETVMSAPEVTNQEPDVFDMDNDMNSEHVTAMDYEDRDVVMEDRDLVLEEEAVPVLNDEGPQAGMAESESPMRFPTLSSDELPGDDDVLATLLGRGTPALKVLQTPAETPVAKTRKRQNIRKRKILMDMATILGAEVMKQQLMNTDDIRRVRRKAPCTRQELWSVQKDTLSQQIFCEPSVPGLSGDLRRLFEQVYVVGEAKLPLAETVETEVDAREEVPGPQYSPLVEDLNTDLNVTADHSAELPIVEDEVQLPTHAFQQVDVEDAAVSDVAAEESVQVQTEASLGEDRYVASPRSALEEVAPSSPLKGASIDVMEAELTAADLNDQHLDMTEVIKMPAAEYHPAVIDAEEIPRDEKEVEQREDEVSVPELVDSVADLEREPTFVPTAETEFETAFEPVADLQSESQIEGDSAPLADLQAEAEVDAEAEAEARVGFEAGTEMVVEAEGAIDVQDQVEQMEAPQEGEFEETNVQGKEPIFEEQVDIKTATPTLVEEVEPVEEQPEEEELGFLADTRDTEFLGADDDDLVEEAEDFQDAKEYGRKESLVQDNSGWSARTRAVGHYLRVTLEDKSAYMQRRQEDGTAKLGLERMLVGKSRKEAARMFFETLVLKTKDYIHVEQAAPYGDIQISARPKLLKAKF